jgi:CRP-like cAMP-binding protein
MATQNDTPMVSSRAIRESPLGLDLDDLQCEKLAGVTSLLGLDTGQTLLSEGACDDTLFVIVGGTLVVEKPVNGGDALLLDQLQSGDMAGIMGFVDGIKHSATIRAQTQCELIALTRPDLESLLKDDPEIVYQVMRAVIRSAHTILGHMNSQFVDMSNYINHQHGLY